uniref:Uncharacterized protein n=1 Tax=Rhizophora mucronata TaxID=61149 RepID=A0A2P2IYE7_RHIMU
MREVKMVIPKTQLLFCFLSFSAGFVLCRPPI